MEKQLPQNVEAEANLLGSILIDAESLLVAMGIVQPHDFYRECHRQIFAAMCDLSKAHHPVDLMTVTDELARRGQLEDMGGTGFVGSLSNQVPTFRNAAHYARIVERTAVLRRLIDAAGNIAAVAYDEPDADEAIATAHTILTTAILRHGGEDSTPIEDAVDRFIVECEETRASGVVPGILTGLTRLDNALMGIKPGELVYLCGRPGSGKSAYAASMAVQAALQVQERDEPGAVEWISLEMTDVHQAKRLIQSLASVNGRLIRAGFRRDDGTFDEDAYHATIEGAQQLKATLKGRIRFIDKPLTMERLGQHLTRAVMRRGCPLAIVDYLGLVDGDDPRANDYKRISDMSRQLKQLALQLRIPILCLVQLNRKCEERANKRPLLSDLRDSGGLEQDADMVLAVYRGAYYNPQLAKVDEHFRQFAEILVLKVREGQANVTIPTRFEGEFTRPGNWPDEWEHQIYLKMTAAQTEKEGAGYGND